jgi:hypothetical protein
VQQLLPCLLLLAGLHRLLHNKRQAYWLKWVVVLVTVLHQALRLVSVALRAVYLVALRVVCLVVD